MITVRRKGDPVVYQFLETDLYVQGDATDHIWGVLHDPLYPGDKAQRIGLRFDSGDSGTLYFTKARAHALIDTVNDLLSQM